MSESRPISTTGNNDEGQVIVDWTQVADDAIRYDTNDEEEVMKAKVKERKRQKAAKQAWQEEQAWLEAKRVVREQAEAKRIVQEAEEQRAHEEEEKRRAEEEKEAEQKCKVEADKGDEAGGEVRKVVMDPGCTHCSRAKVACEFLIDGNKKRVACVRCNLSKGKCQWPGDRKDAEAGPKVKADKGKKRKADDGMPKPRLIQRKWAKSRPTEVLEIDEPKASGSGVRKASAGGPSGLEEKLKQLIDVTGLIANNLAGLFELHETVAENLGCIADVLESLLDESYGFGMAVSPSDSVWDTTSGKRATRGRVKGEFPRIVPRGTVWKERSRKGLEAVGKFERESRNLIPGRCRRVRSSKMGI
ncbi:hypothetical protein BKA82DRAFT_28153 [Pisolithus tinctorius]|uniref:Zn(2)-C6 fungal-type domain-containing protein n=1 Tax=Pisolithus tinctorius Marx 270 TaxID=870435 RepID=A0A0C3JWY1_PISTI|nr:hypothetical protein BKA82DRAFT_28153 [Pisolithus tinctorius]KIO01897.1 hypothetical protein M404DRAFT_28153 [Pisolithus tinctorius Marx 270]